jgi:hypothetical protein
LYLKADTQLDKTSVEGTMGGPLFIVPESRDREKEECDSEAKWCFTWKAFHENISYDVRLILVFDFM